MAWEGRKGEGEEEEEVDASLFVSNLFFEHPLLVYVLLDSSHQKLF